MLYRLLFFYRRNRIGEPQRRNRTTTLTAHPHSAIGQRARDIHRNGWRFAGIGDHGLLIFEDVSLIGRIRCFMRREQIY
ncbi:hypothetical protein [Sphingobium sp. MK2]|uniref:hypothetical protein n=1 Tax=Sphingobium sp. MK2 TaxID=3116540 RepID=UPI0032E35AD1